MAYTYSREQATSFEAMNPSKTNSYVAPPTTTEIKPVFTSANISPKSYSGVSTQPTITPITSSSGSIIGYEDTAAKQSVSLPKNTTLSKEAIANVEFTRQQEVGQQQEQQAQTLTQIRTTALQQALKTPVTIPVVDTNTRETMNYVGGVKPLVSPNKNIPFPIFSKPVVYETVGKKNIEWVWDREGFLSIIPRRVDNTMLSFGVPTNTYLQGERPFLQATEQTLPSFFGEVKTKKIGTFTGQITLLPVTEQPIKTISFGSLISRKPFEELTISGEKTLFDVEKSVGFKESSPTIENTFKSWWGETKVYVGETLTNPAKAVTTVGLGAATAIALKNPNYGFALGETLLVTSIPAITSENLFAIKEEQKTGGTGFAKVTETGYDFALFGLGMGIGGKLIASEIGKTKINAPIKVSKYNFEKDLLDIEATGRGTLEGKPVRYSMETMEGGKVQKSTYQLYDVKNQFPSGIRKGNTIEVLNIGTEEFVTIKSPKGNILSETFKFTDFLKKPIIDITNFGLQGRKTITPEEAEKNPLKFKRLNKGGTFFNPKEGGVGEHTELDVVELYGSKATSSQQKKGIKSSIELNINDIYARKIQTTEQVTGKQTYDIVKGSTFNEDIKIGEVIDTTETIGSKNYGINSKVKINKKPIIEILGVSNNKVVPKKVYNFKLKNNEKVGDIFQLMKGEIAEQGVGLELKNVEQIRQKPEIVFGNEFKTPESELKIEFGKKELFVTGTQAPIVKETPMA